MLDWGIVRQPDFWVMQLLEKVQELEGRIVALEVQLEAQPPPPADDTKRPPSQ